MLAPPCQALRAAHEQEVADLKGNGASESIATYHKNALTITYVHLPFTGNGVKTAELAVEDCDITSRFGFGISLTSDQIEKFSAACKSKGHRNRKGFERPGAELHEALARCSRHLS